MYARHHRCYKPIITYEFSCGRCQKVALDRFAGFTGYVQADAYPGYNALFAQTLIKEVACFAIADENSL